MLIVTQDEFDLRDCFSLAAACGLTDLGTWSQHGVFAQTAIDHAFSGPTEREPERVSLGIAVSCSAPRG